MTEPRPSEPPPYVVDQMISAKAIAARVEDLAAEITTAFAGTASWWSWACCAAAFVFIADLVREIDLPVEVDFLEASSYGDALESSREVRILKDLRGEIAGRDVLVVEDIVDTGFTLHHVKNLLLSRGRSGWRSARCWTSRRDARYRSRQPGPDSRSPTNSSWAMASTTASATATCPSSARCASPARGDSAPRRHGPAWPRGARGLRRWRAQKTGSVRFSRYSVCQIQPLDRRPKCAFFAGSFSLPLSSVSFCTGAPCPIRWRKAPWQG
jgi:hypoxanthine phosphoribosyltransferase